MARKRAAQSVKGLEKDATYVVAHPAHGEIKFTTDDSGSVTPKNEKEVWALQQLGFEVKEDNDA